MQEIYVKLAKQCRLVASRRSSDSRDGWRPSIFLSRNYVHRRKCKALFIEASDSIRSGTARGAASPPQLTVQQLTTTISRSQGLEELYEICISHWDGLNHIHVAAAFSAAVKLSGPRRASATRLLDSLTALFAQTLPGATIREVATVLWSLAKLGRPAPHHLLQVVLAALEDYGLLRAASPQALSNILWSLATWRTRGPDTLLQLLLERCCEALPAFHPQDTANVLWALARFERPHRHTHRRGHSSHGQEQPDLLPLPSRLLTGLLTAAAVQAGEMAPQGLAMSVWACSRLRVPHSAFLRSAVAAFRAQLPAASPTDVALFTASLAQLGFRCPALLRAVAERCCGGGGGAAAATHGSRQEPGCSPLRPKEDAATGVGVGTGAGMVGWSPLSRQRLLWAFAALEFRHGPAVRALLLGSSTGAGAGNRGGGEGAGSASEAATLSWSWEPGGLTGGDNEGEEEEEKDGGADIGTEGRVALAASNFIWCMARLGCGRSEGPEQRAVLAAADRLWAVRSSAALSHLAVAAWGLEHLGLAQERLLRLACVRLLQALDRAAAAAGGRRCSSGGGDGQEQDDDRGQGASSGSGGLSTHVLADGLHDTSRVGAGASVPNSRDRNSDPDLSLALSPGDLDAAVMVLRCLGRRRQLAPPSSPGNAADQAPGTREGLDVGVGGVDPLAEVGAEAAEERVLDAFAAASRSLLPRLSPRQLPLVCCAYVRRGRSDAAVLGGAAELLMGPSRPSAGAEAVTHVSSRDLRERRAAAPAQDGDDAADGGRRWVGVVDPATGTQPREALEEGQASEREPDRELQSDSPSPNPRPERGHPAAGGDGDGGRASDRNGSGAGRDAGRGDSGPTSGPAEASSDRLLGRLPRNGLAMTLWALASSGHASPRLMQLAAEEVVRLFPPLPAEELAEGGAEASGERLRNQSLMTGVSANEAASSRRGPNHSGEAVGVREPGTTAPPAGGAVASRWAALILWAFAASDCYNTVLYDTLLSYIVRKVPRLGPGRVALVLWACAVSGHHRRDVMEALSGALAERVWALPPASFTQANWAVAHLTAGVCLTWRGPAAAHLASLAPSLSRHQAAVMLWSLAVQQLVLAAQDRRKFVAAVELMMAQLEAGEGEAGAPPAPADPRVADAPVGTADAADAIPVSPPRATTRLEADPDLNRGLVPRRTDSGQSEPQQDHSSRNLGAVQAPLEPGVALIAAEALALLLASPHRAVRVSVQDRLRLPPRPPGPLPGAEGLEPGAEMPPSTPPPSQLPSSQTVNTPEYTVTRGAVQGTAHPDEGATRTLAPLGDSARGEPALARTGTGGGGGGRGSGGGGGGDSGRMGSLLAFQLAATWQRALRRRHPQQTALAAAARQLGYSPRLLRTHGAFPVALPSAVELPDASPRPAVLLLAERSDFAINEVGQPLGPLFTTVQLLKERGWLVAVVVAEQFASMRLVSRQTRHLKNLLTAAGVETAGWTAPQLLAAGPDGPAAPAALHD